MRRSRWPGLACIAIAAAACGGDRDAPQRPPTPTPAAPSPAAPSPAPSAATALANIFAPDVFGAIAPREPSAGDYAMSLTMSFSTFVTTELRIDEHRDGALRLTLARDGTTRACVGSRHDNQVLGQRNYEPPERRQHHEDHEAILLAFTGTWKIVDGVAVIQFDHMTSDTCDVAAAAPLAAPFPGLRCIGVGPTDRVPAGSLACEADDPSQLLQLGMPMTPPVSRPPPGPPRAFRGGHSFVLGAPGLVVDVVQGAQAEIPTITFRAGAVSLVEAAYRSKK